jgi:hypothetical protein
MKHMWTVRWFGLLMRDISGVDGYDVGDLVKSQTMREFTINTKILT